MKVKVHKEYNFTTEGWYNIKTFDDALKLNIEFLRGQTNSTIYLLTFLQKPCLLVVM